MESKLDYLEYWASWEQCNDLKRIKAELNKILNEIKDYHKPTAEEWKEINKQAKNFLID